MRNLWRLIASRTTGKIARRIEQPPMKLPSLIFWILFIACCPSLAAQDERIAALAARPYTMISGGERQLVLLARALVQEPQFIVLDEPTASLDFGNQGKVMSEIRALARSGHGVLFTTHDPNHALRAADRAYLLREGKRLDEGPVDTVLQRAQLEALYGAPVQLISDENRRAFLPG